MQKIAGNLTSKQIRGITALLSSRTIGEAAQKADVSERTIHAWLTEADFRAELRSAENETIEFATRRLLSGQQQALDSLELLATKGRSESVRRQAANDWLNLLLKFRDLQDIDQRLEDLEAAVFENEK